MEVDAFITGGDVVIPAPDFSKEVIWEEPEVCENPIN